MRRRLLCASTTVAVVVAAGCTASTEPAAAPTSVMAATTTTTNAVTDTTDETTDTTSEASKDDGAIARVDFVHADIDVDDLDASGGTWDLQTCAWRWIGQYQLTIDWRPPAGGSADAAVDVPAEFLIITGDVGYAGAAGTIALGAAGRYVVDIDVDPVASGDDDELVAAGRGSVGGVGGRCALIGSGDRGGSADVSVDPRPPSAGAWPEGSLEALAASVDVADPDAPLSPLPFVVFSGVDLPVDRWYLAPDLRLGSITAREEGACLRLRSVIEFHDDGWVEVEQSRGCVHRPSNGAYRVVQIDDPNWRVVVAGAAADVDLVVDELVAYTAADVPPVTGPPEAGADEYFAGYLAEHPEFEIVARLPWRGGEFAVLRDATFPDSWSITETVYYGDQDWNGGGAGQSCREHSTRISRRFDEGYAWFVSVDPTDVVAVPVDGGGAVTIELEPFDSGYGAAIVDIADVPVDEVDRFPEFRTSEGEPVPCTQHATETTEP
ncbi:MAG: hypothetical protein R8G01_05605 [Ilumatobacteraceae bacterium]|nr:hypothetical protein [Ilumatobacteraceae bacterium]